MGSRSARGFRAAPTLAVAFWLAALGGCRSVPTLPSERTMPERAARLDALCAMPGRVARVPTTACGVTIALEEKGRFDAGRRYVFLHGLLSDRRVWRFVAADLGRDSDVVLVDLPGCGESTGPDPAIVGDAPYTPQALAAAVLDALRRDPTARPGDTRPITLVAHSFGGAVVLRMLAEEDLARGYADVLRRVDSAVLLAPTDVGLERQPPEFVTVGTASALEVSLARATGILRREVTSTVIASSTGRGGAVSEEAERMTGAIVDPQKRRAAQAMMRGAVPWRADGRPDWPAIDRLDRLYARVRPPCLVVWGRHDEVLSSSTGHRIRDRLPRAWLRIVPEGTHTLPVEFASECATLLRDFPRTMGAGWASVADVPSTATLSVPARVPPPCAPPSSARAGSAAR